VIAPRHAARYGATVHEIVGIQIVIECACGDLLHGDTEQHAIVDFETHVNEQEDQC
jgi:hypothetical protein